MPSEKYQNQGLQELTVQILWKMLKSQLIISDLCWDHVSMPVADWIQLPVLLHFSMQKQRKKQQGLPEILQLLIRAEKLSLRKEKKKAIRIIETTELKNDRVLVVYLPDCHESLAGIIAGRIREKYHKACLCIDGR